MSETPNMDAFEIITPPEATFYYICTSPELIFYLI